MILCKTWRKKSEVNKWHWHCFVKIMKNPDWTIPIVEFYRRCVSLYFADKEIKEMTQEPWCAVYTLDKCNFNWHMWLNVAKKDTAKPKIAANDGRLWWTKHNNTVIYLICKQFIRFSFFMLNTETSDSGISEIYNHFRLTNIHIPIMKHDWNCPLFLFYIYTIKRPFPCMAPEAFKDCESSTPTCIAYCSKLPNSKQEKTNPAIYIQ